MFLVGAELGPGSKDVESQIDGVAQLGDEVCKAWAGVALEEPLALAREVVVGAGVVGAPAAVEQAVLQDAAFGGRPVRHVGPIVNIGGWAMGSQPQAVSHQTFEDGRLHSKQP